MDEKILNIREAAELTRLTVNTLYAYTARRKIPFIKLGAKVLFRQSDLEKWIDQHRVEPIGSRV